VSAAPTSLIVGDDPDARNLLAEMCGAQGLTVVEAADGEAALEAIARVTPTLPRAARDRIGRAERDRGPPPDPGLVANAAGHHGHRHRRRPHRRGGHAAGRLVEDEDQVCDLESELLTGLGYRVLTAVNGADALALCQHHRGPIDLMLSDVIMPVMSGPEAAARLQAVRPDMKALFVSGYTDSAIAPHGEFELGVTLLLKPFDPAELARAACRSLDRAAVTVA
jgi:CheY-like chemotaxis protein